MDDGPVVRLSLARNVRRTQARLLVACLVGLPLFTGTVVVTGDGAFGNGMIVGLLGAVIELPEVQETVVYRQDGGRHESLVLNLDGHPLVVGNSASGGLFDPTGLHALAAGLALSPLPEVQDTASWLHDFAETPGVEAWP
jgi:hypothetical protein